MEAKIQALLSTLKQSAKELNELGLNPGATAAQIQQVEEVTGQALPNDFKLFLQHINGQQPQSHWFLLDEVKLLSCDEIIEEWTEGQEYAEDTAEYYDEFHFDDKIRCTIYHASRIPFASQEGFGFMAIDYAPGPNGKVGQVIYLVNECDFIVIADSFSAFVDWCIEHQKN